MVRSNLAFALLAAAALLVAPDRGAAGEAAGDVQHVYVMRHLQKAVGEDPPLTEEGARLANLLPAQLADARIRAVFATATVRAQQTGAPLARAAGVPVSTYDPKNVPELVKQVRAVPGSVLVVGHSNTVPDLVAAFGGARPEPLSDDDYGTVFEIAGKPEVRRIELIPDPARPAPGGERGR